MLQPEIDAINKLDQAVQTSLVYWSSDSKDKAKEELRKLQEDKSLLEGKIRGYLTLSDICREYKEELTKLRQDYNKLLEKVNLQSSLSMGLENHRTGSPTSDKDPGPYKGHETDQRSHPHDFHPHQHSSLSPRNKTSGFSELDHNSPVKTKELFDQVEDPKKSSEGHKSMPHSFDPKVSFQDKFPMQESMAEDSSQSVTGLGFEQVRSIDMAVGQSAAHLRHSGDLMTFSYPQGRPPPTDTTEKPVLSAEVQDLEHILKSTKLDSNGQDLEKVIAEVKSYTDKRLTAANQVLVDRNNELKRKIHSLEETNKRLLEKIRQLEKQLYDLSSSRSSSPQDQGWVQVEKPTKAEEVKQTTSSQQKVTISSEELELLKQRNMQLTEANQRWSSEWNKLQEHCENMVAEVQAERDRLAKEVTELKISDEAKQRDFEKMLMNSKKKAGEEENAKEEAFLQLTSANNQLEDIRCQLRDSEERIKALKLEKQTLQTELSVIRQTPLAAGTLTQSQGPRPNKSLQEFKTENDVLRQQLMVFQEDFDRERQDRAKAMSSKDEYKKQVEQYKKRSRHVEQKNVGLEKQLKNLEENCKKLQSEKSELQQEVTRLNTQLSHEANRNRNFVPSQMPYQPPLIQSAGLQPERQMIFGQPIQPRPQQYAIPYYEQPFRLPPVNVNGMNFPNMSPAGAQYQLPPQQQAPGLYQVSQAGKQMENRPGSWSCSQCTYVNYPGRTVCEMCGYIMSTTSNQAFNYRPLGNDTLHPRGEPNRLQGPPQGFGGFSEQRN